MARKARSLYDEVGDRKTIYLADEKPKGKSCFLGRKFMLIAMDTYRILYELEAPHTAHKVMYWLCQHNEYGNLVSRTWTQQQIAEDCRTTRQRVCEMLKILEAHNLIMVRGRGHCVLNPYLWFRGALDQQQDACDSWDQMQRELGQPASPQAVAR